MLPQRQLPLCMMANASLPRPYVLCNARRVPGRLLAIALFWGLMGALASCAGVKTGDGMSGSGGHGGGSGAGGGGGGGGAGGGRGGGSGAGLIGDAGSGENEPPLQGPAQVFAHS